MQNKLRLIIPLLFLSLALFVSPIINLTDTTEGRYATIGKEMAATGNYITPMVWHSGKHLPYLGKPPLQFWMIAASINIFGANAFAARFPSFMAAALLLIMMYVILKRYIDPEIAEMVVYVLIASPFFFVYSASVILDMTLTLCVGTAVFCQIALMNEKIKDRQTAWSLAVFAALALGMLTKGPIAVVIFGFPVVLWSLWNRNSLAFRNHRWGSGILLFTAISLPWFLIAEKHNPGFLRYFFINENLMRYISHHYGDRYGTGHSHLPGTALLYLIFGCLPWFLWVGALLVKKEFCPVVDGLWKDLNIRFFLLGAAGYVLFLCLARQLTPTYLLPVIPWVAVCLSVCMHGLKIPLTKIKTVARVLILVYVAVLLAGAPIINRNTSSRQVIRYARQHHMNGPLYFFRDTPGTAYFYGQDLISIHPTKQDDINIAKTIDDSIDYLYIIKDRDLKRVSPENLDRLFLAGSAGIYHFYRKKSALAMRPLR